MSEGGCPSWWSPGVSTRPGGAGPSPWMALPVAGPPSSAIVLFFSRLSFNIASTDRLQKRKAQGISTRTAGLHPAYVGGSRINEGKIRSSKDREDEPAKGSRH